MLNVSEELKKKKASIFKGSFVIILVHSLTSGSQITADGGHRVNMSLKNVLSNKNRSTPLILYTENKNKNKNKQKHLSQHVFLPPSAKPFHRQKNLQARYYRRPQSMSCNKLQQQHPNFSVVSLLEVPLLVKWQKLLQNWTETPAGHGYAHGETDHQPGSLSLQYHSFCRAQLR